MVAISDYEKACFEERSSHGLHQTATRGGVIIVVVFGVSIPKGVDADGSGTNQAGKQPEGTTADRIDEFAHKHVESRITVTKNCALCRPLLIFGVSARTQGRLKR